MLTAVNYRPNKPGVLLRWVGIAVGVGIAASLNWLVSVAKRAGYKRSDRTSDLTIFITDLMNNIWEEFARYIEGATVRELPGGHMVHFESPDAVARIITEFFS